MTFEEMVEQVTTVLQREERISYRALKRRFDLGDDDIEDLKDELIYAKRVARDEDGRVLVWSSEAVRRAASTSHREHVPLAYTPPHLAEKILQSRSALEGERKQVTVLFADVAGFTSIAEQHDPEVIHALMDGCFARLSEAIHRYEGTINQYTGDGVMALFGAPVAHEDHAQHALLAALDIQASMRAYTEQIRVQYAVDFRLRIGINTGLVVVGRIGDNLRMDYTAQGDTTNLAARLQSLAEADTVLVSAHTYRMTQGFFTFVPLGEREVKGRAPAEVFQVTGRQTRRTRIDAAVEQGLSAFIGRQGELDTLMTILHQVKSGAGQVVGVLGEAGMGKSRLLLEFRRRLQDEEVIYLEGRCLSYGQSMLYVPLVDMLKLYFGIEDDRTQSIEAHIMRGLEQAGLDPVDTAPYLIALLTGRADHEPLRDLTPAVRQKQTFESVRRLFLALSCQRPLVLAVEDPHWIDQLSEAFFALLGESLAAAPILLLLIHRPGYQHHWAEKSCYTQIVLQPLSEADSGAIIASVLGAPGAPSDLQTFIAQQAEGNPFYLEEITRSFLERGIIEREGATYHFSRGRAGGNVPETIQDIIASRLDRLSEEQKYVVQTAAVIGREFAVRILQLVAEPPERLEACIRALQDLEFIYEKHVVPEREYMFKHILTQEVAYHGLLATQRQRLHTAIGFTIEDLYGERLAEHYEKLAYHFTQGEAWEKAFYYLAVSGDKARQAYANQEAIAFYSQAIEASEHLTSTVDEARLLSVYEGRGLVWMLLSDLDAAIADFHRMRDAGQASGNLRKEGESLAHLAFAHWSKLSEDQLPFMEQYALEAIELAQRTGDQKIVARGLTSLGLVHQVHGTLQEGDRKLEESLQISQREGYHDATAQNLLWLNAHAYWQGDLHRALPLCQESLRISRDIADGFAELLTLAFLCLEYGSLGDYAAAFRSLEEGLTKAQERANMLVVGRLTNTRGWLHHELGDVVGAIRYDQESVELGRTNQIPNVEISALINLGYDYLALGQYDQALAYFAPTLERVERDAFGSHRWRWKIRLQMGLAEHAALTGAYAQALQYVDAGLSEAQATSSQKYVAKGWALRGSVLAQLGEPDAAGVELQRGFTLAEQLQSPSLLYPIAYDLGRWYEMSGKSAEAVSQYKQAKAMIERIAMSVEDDALHAAFLQAALVQSVYTGLSRATHQPALGLDSHGQKR